jgi:hypothetical protein
MIVLCSVLVGSCHLALGLDQYSRAEDEDGAVAPSSAASGGAGGSAGGALGGAGGGGEGGLGGTGGCFNADEAVTINGFDPMPSGNNVCSAAQVDALLAACFDRTATPRDCDTFAAAQPSCFACAYAGYDTGDPVFSAYYPLLMPIGNYFSYVNDLACHFAQAGRLDCAVPVANQTFCRASVCGSCSTFRELDPCLAFAGTQAIALCDDIVIPAGCDAIGPDPACEGADFVALLAAVVTVMCGP